MTPLVVHQHLAALEGACRPAAPRPCTGASRWPRPRREAPYRWPRPPAAAGSPPRRTAPAPAAWARRCSRTRHRPPSCRRRSPLRSPGRRCRTCAGSPRSPESHCSRSGSRLRCWGCRRHTPRPSPPSHCHRQTARSGYSGWNSCHRRRCCHRHIAPGYRAGRRHRRRRSTRSAGADLCLALPGVGGGSCACGPFGVGGWAWEWALSLNVEKPTETFRRHLTPEVTREENPGPTTGCLLTRSPCALVDTCLTGQVAITARR